MKKTINRKRIIISAVAFCFIPLAAGLTAMMVNTQEPQAEMETIKPVPVVSVSEIRLKEWQASFVANGVVQPKNQMVLTSEIGGRVLNITDQFVEGMHVKAGTALAYIDPIQSQRDVAVAEQSLAEAKVAYLQEERKTRQAKRDWKRLNNGKAPTSPLVLNGPQLEAAKARVVAADMAVKVAKNQLAKTVIRSPFDAVVLKRAINKGQVLARNTDVATLFEREGIQINIDVSERKWRLISTHVRQALEQGHIVSTSMKLRDPLNPDYIWTASSLRMGGARNAKTRQRRLIIELDRRDVQQWDLLPGSFVQTTFVGDRLANILDVPTTALNVNGYLWTVDENQRLVRHKVKTLSMQKGRAFLISPTQAKTLNVVVNPLASYLPGQEVRAQKIQPKTASSSARFKENTL